MMKWYVMNVFNGKEKSVKENILKQLELNGMIKLVNQVLIPREKTWEIKKGKKVKSEKNYLPGYIIIECEMNGELMKYIKNVKGVISFLTNSDGKAIPMKDSEVNSILGKVEELEQNNEIRIDNDFIEGQYVTIIDGPFQSMNGSITKINNEKGRAIVDVSIFNRKTPVDLSFEQINAL